MLDPILADLLAECAANPEDAARRFVAADRCEDLGLAYWAEALRWMGNEGRWAHDNRKERSGEAYPFTWWKDTKRADAYPHHSLLPLGSTGFHRSFARTHETNAAAEMALYEDWAESRENSWEPPASALTANWNVAAAKVEATV